MDSIQEKNLIADLRSEFPKELAIYLDDEIIEAYEQFPGVTAYTRKEIVEWMTISPLEKLRLARNQLRKSE